MSYLLCTVCVCVCCVCVCLCDACVSCTWRKKGRLLPASCRVFLAALQTNVQQQVHSTHTQTAIQLVLCVRVCVRLVPPPPPPFHTRRNDSAQQHERAKQPAKRVQPHTQCHHKTHVDRNVCGMNMCVCVSVSSENVR